MRAPSIPIAATLSISLVLALQGCASTKEDIFPKKMRPMSEVYDRHFAKLRMRGIEGARVQLHGEHPPPLSETSPATNLAAQVPPAAHGQAHPELAGYTREAHDEIEARFPVLPNPQLIYGLLPLCKHLFVSSAAVGERSCSHISGLSMRLAMPLAPMEYPRVFFIHAGVVSRPCGLDSGNPCRWYGPIPLAFTARIGQDGGVDSIHQDEWEGPPCRLQQSVLIWLSGYFI